MRRRAAFATVLTILQSHANNTILSTLLALEQPLHLLGTDYLSLTHSPTPTSYAVTLPQKWWSQEVCLWAVMGMR